MSQSLSKPWILAAAHQALQSSLDSLDRIKSEPAEAAQGLETLNQLLQPIDISKRCQIIRFDSTPSQDAPGRPYTGILSDQAHQIACYFSSASIAEYEKLNNAMPLASTQGGIMIISSYSCQIRQSESQRLRVFLKIHRFQFIGGNGSNYFGSLRYIDDVVDIEQLCVRLQQRLNECRTLASIGIASHLPQHVFRIGSHPGWPDPDPSVHGPYFELGRHILKADDKSLPDSLDYFDSIDGSILAAMEGDSSSQVRAESDVKSTQIPLVAPESKPADKVESKTLSIFISEANSLSSIEEDDPDRLDIDNINLLEHLESEDESSRPSAATAPAGMSSQASPNVREAAEDFNMPEKAQQHIVLDGASRAAQDDTQHDPMPIPMCCDATPPLITQVPSGAKCGTNPSFDPDDSWGSIDWDDVAACADAADSLASRINQARASLDRAEFATGYGRLGAPLGLGLGLGAHSQSCPSGHPQPALLEHSQQTLGASPSADPDSQLQLISTMDRPSHPNQTQSEIRARLLQGPDATGLGSPYPTAYGLMQGAVVDDVEASSRSAYLRLQVSDSFESRPLAEPRARAGSPAELAADGALLTDSFQDIGFVTQDKGQLDPCASEDLQPESLPDQTMPHTQHHGSDTNYAFAKRPWDALELEAYMNQARRRFIQLNR
ncbi:uncharacterized protein BJ171DRAFT_499183 [Polychytrium aggregatum]|uniref:uncharacterized protein n=1 Tax=Polychytrium aggregatum TaxID=110093 RepID=UPI0022FE86D2|nr:uncharacterized protein BJ171DRAFT_499183 [Polychytrium aggregatum]KAI9206239.1 hypothetical protein BJ171DRAFT_499183 [Polychytrium aggregatum]